LYSECYFFFFEVRRTAVFFAFARLAGFFFAFFAAIGHIPLFHVDVSGGTLPPRNPGQNRPAATRWLNPDASHYQNLIDF